MRFDKVNGPEAMERTERGENGPGKGRKKGQENGRNNAPGWRVVRKYQGLFSGEEAIRRMMVVHLEEGWDGR